MSKMRKTEKLILQSEVKSLSFTMYTRTVAFSLFLAFSPFFSRSQVELYLTYSLLTLVILYLVYSFRNLKMQKNLFLTGLSGVILDITVFTSLPVIWYISVGGANVEPAFMIKSPTYYAFLFSFLILNSLALQPKIILVYSVLGWFSITGHFIYLLVEGRTVFTSDYRLHNIGNAVSIEFVFIQAFVLLSSGVILFFLTRNFRKTLFKAVAGEVTATQLGRYFSPAVRESLASDDLTEDIEAGRSQKVAILFSDIRGFTSFSEKHSAADVVSFLKQYHSLMVDCIFKNRGSIDKFLGDGIMATFGTPHPGPDDAVNAVRTATMMKRALAEMNEQRKLEGKSAIVQGIGVHYGEVIAGNVGSAERLEYTVIGDAVNMASRLESATKQLGVSILLSSDIAVMTDKHFRLKSLGAIALKGKQDNVDVFTLE